MEDRSEFGISVRDDDSAEADLARASSGRSPRLRHGDVKLGGVGEQGPGRRQDDEAAVPARCAHCGRVFRPNSGVGRPGKYCRRSCRQRAFEQRRHAGDQAWSDARLIVMSEQLAAQEDAVDRLGELLDELRADDADDVQLELSDVVERLERALGESSEFVTPGTGHGG